MTCKFERALASDGSVVLHVSGRIDGTSADTLHETTEKEKKLEGGFAIDLAEVTLVSREAIRTLSLVASFRSSGPPAPASFRRDGRGMASGSVARRIRHDDRRPDSRGPSERRPSLRRPRPRLVWSIRSVRRRRRTTPDGWFRTAAESGRALPS